jgi:uncharacterized protein with von Willebrand factor type A (vWA) domain
MAEGNILNPDPSLATNERLANATTLINDRIERTRNEVKGWVEALQLLEERERQAAGRLFEQKISSAEDKTNNLDRVVQTRLAGSETALNAAMSAADKVTQEIKLNFGAVMNETKAGIAKQVEGLDEKIEDLKKRVFESGGRVQGVSSVVTLVIAGLAALAAISAVVITLSRPAAPLASGIHSSIMRYW